MSVSFQSKGKTAWITAAIWVPVALVILLVVLTSTLSASTSVYAQEPTQPEPPVVFSETVQLRGMGEQATSQAVATGADMVLFSYSAQEIAVTRGERTGSSWEWYNFGEDATKNAWATVEWPDILVDHQTVVGWNFPATEKLWGWGFGVGWQASWSVPFGRYSVTVTVGCDNEVDSSNNQLVNTVVVTEPRLASGVVVSPIAFKGHAATVTGVITNVGLVPTEFGGGFLLVDTNGDLVFYEEVPMTGLNPGEVFELSKVFTPTVVGNHRLHLLVSQPYGPPPPDVIVDFEVHEWPDELGVELAVFPNPVKVNKPVTVVITNPSSIPLGVTVYFGHEEWWEVGLLGPGLSVSGIFTPSQTGRFPINVIGEWEGPRVSASADLTVENWIYGLPMILKAYPPMPRLVIEQPDITVWLTRRGTEERYLWFRNDGTAPLVGSGVAITKPEGPWMGGATYFETGLEPDEWEYIWLHFNAGNTPGLGTYKGVVRFTTNDPRGVIEIPVTLHVMRQEDIPTPTRALPTATPAEDEPIQTPAPTPRSVQAVKPGPLSALATGHFASPFPTATPTSSQTATSSPTPPTGTPTPTATPSPTPTYIPGW